MGSKILVVDDAKFSRNMIKKALKNGGYEDIIEAASAAEALEAFKSGSPDLVMLDITLPDRNDLSLLQELLQIRPDARIIMVSALGQDLIIADALKIGARDFITKPFVEQDMLAVVMSVLFDE